MQRCAKLLPLVFIVALSGCQGIKKTTVTSRPDTPVLKSTSVKPPRMSEDDAVRKQLATCLFEAEQLLKLNQEKHREPVNKLYQYIQAGKYYASVSTHLSTGTTDTLTPMYQYKINDACNTISQLLLSELKQGGVVTGKR